MNIEGQPENFHHQALQSAEDCRVINKALYQQKKDLKAMPRVSWHGSFHLAVLVSKETSLPLSIVTSPWFHTLVFRRDPYVYMGQQFDNLESTFLFKVYVKRISSNHVACPSLSHNIFTCVSVCQYMLSTYMSISTSCWKYVRDQVTLHTWTLELESGLIGQILFWSVIPRVTVCQSRWVLFLSTIATIKLPWTMWYHMVGNFHYHKI